MVFADYPVGFGAGTRGGAIVLFVTISEINI